MAKAKELYISLRDDVNLSIPEGETRESAAWNETSHRLRQHQSNAKALSMASEVSEPSSIEKFADFIEKAKRIEAKPVGPFKSKKAFTEALKDVTGTQEKGSSKVLSWFNDLTPAKQKQLATNIDTYFSQADQDEDSPDAHADLLSHSSSLEGEERDTLLNQLADNKNPFTVDAGVGAAELRSKGYVAGGQKVSAGKYRLSPDGASHLLGESRLKQSGKKPFNISAARFSAHSVDLTDEGAEWSTATRVKRVLSLKEEQDQLARDMTDEGIFENRKAADRTIRETTDDDTDFDEHYEKISDYHKEMGEHPIKSSGSKGHIDNLNNNTTNPVRQHVPKGADTPTEEAPKEEAPTPSDEKFKANIHGINLQPDDVELQPNGKYKLTEEGKELFSYDEIVGENSFTRDPMSDENQKKYLDDLEFSSGDNISGNVGSKVKRADAPKTTAENRAERQAKGRELGIATPATDRAVADAKAAEEKPAKDAAELPQAEANSIMDVLDEHHNRDNVGKITDEGTAFNALKDKLGGRLLRGELTQDDIKDISEHLATHDKDTAVVSASNSVSSQQMTDVLRAGYVAPEQGGDDPLSPTSEDETAKAARTAAAADEAAKVVEAAKVAAKKKADAEKSPEQIVREDKVGNLIAHHSDGLKAAYEKEYGPVEDNTDENDYSFDDYKAGLLQEHSSSDVKVGNFKKFAAKHTNTARKAEEAKESAKATKDKTAKENAEKDARTAKITDLENRAAGSKDLKMSKKEAEALIDEHGDVDTAFDAHEKAFADKTKKQESANKLPYTTDELSLKIFGDIDPTSRLTHLSADRKKNKYGEVSTSLARELIAHYKTHAGVMDAKTEKELEEQLAFLKDPSKRFPNMRIPKGETIGADIKAANDMVNEAQEKGFALDGPEAGRLYEKREAERTRRVLHHQTAHVNPTTDENKKISHGEGVDPNEERTGVFSETDNTSFIEFHEEGHPKAGQPKSRKRLGSERTAGEDFHESFRTDGSDDHHIRGDHEARGSRVKEHVVPSHGNHLNDKEKESLGSLREAHKAKEDAVRSGDDAASAKADEDIAQHTQDLTAGDMGLKESDFLHDEDDIPTVGPPNPEIAVQQRAKGLEWNEAISHWVRRDQHDERTKAAGSAFSHVGDGASMGIETATMGADGVVTSTPSPQTFIHTNNGQYHAVDTTPNSIPSTKAGVQAQKLGAVDRIQEKAAAASSTGQTQMMAARDHGHLTAHGASSAPKKDIFDRTGSAAKKVAGAPKKAATGAASFARRLIGLRKLVEEESYNLSSVQSLQLHIALQKLEEKQKTAV